MFFNELAKLKIIIQLLQNCQTSENDDFFLSEDEHHKNPNYVIEIVPLLAIKRNKNNGKKQREI